MQWLHGALPLSKPRPIHFFSYVYIYTCIYVYIYVYLFYVYTSYSPYHTFCYDSITSEVNLGHFVMIVKIEKGRVFQIWPPRSQLSAVLFLISSTQICIYLKLYSLFQIHSWYAQAYMDSLTRWQDRTAGGHLVSCPCRWHQLGAYSLLAPITVLEAMHLALCFCIYPDFCMHSVALEHFLIMIFYSVNYRYNTSAWQTLGIFIL